MRWLQRPPPLEEGGVMENLTVDQHIRIRKDY